MKRTLFDTHENTATLQMAYPDGPFWTTAAPFRVPLLVMERKCLVVLIRYWMIIERLLNDFFCASEALETNEIQQNKYETNPYFLQIFQSNMSDCLIISLFCKSWEHICEPEITPTVFPPLNSFRTCMYCDQRIVSAETIRITLHENQNKNKFLYSVQFTNLTKPGNKQCHALEILKKIWIHLAFI